MDEVRLNAEQAVMTNQIEELDRRMSELDEHTRKSAEWGLLGSGAVAGALAREKSQRQHYAARTTLTAQRQVLAGQLRESIEQSQK